MLVKNGCFSRSLQLLEYLADWHAFLKSNTQGISKQSYVCLEVQNKSGQPCGCAPKSTPALLFLFEQPRAGSLIDDQMLELVTQVHNPYNVGSGAEYVPAHFRICVTLPHFLRSFLHTPICVALYALQNPANFQPEWNCRNLFV